MPNAIDRHKTDYQVMEWGRATAMTVDMIEDRTRHWVSNQWRGWIVRVRGGTNDCAISQIAENDSHSLKLDTRLPFIPEVPLDSTYELIPATVTVEGMNAVEARLNSLEQAMGLTNLLLAQIRYGIGRLVGMPLDEIDPDQG